MVNIKVIGVLVTLLALWDLSVNNLVSIPNAINTIDLTANSSEALAQLGVGLSAIIFGGGEN